jgi:hypothetical protein
MFIKIVHFDMDESEQRVLFECREMRWYKIHEGQQVAVNDDYREYFQHYDGVQKPLKNTAEMWLYTDDKKPVQVLLCSNALVYVMNEEGKTVDRYHA